MGEPRPSQLWEAATRRDPHPFYDHVRRSGRPVLQVDPTGRRMWVVAGYDDVLAGLQHPDLSHDIGRPDPDGHASPGPTGRTARVARRQLISLDPPDHTRLRRLVSPHFTAAAVRALEPVIVTVVSDLVDRLHPTTTFDAVDDLIDPLPVGVIAAVVGVPPTDRARFRAWSAAIVSHDDVDDLASESLLDYVDALATHRREHPGNDVLSALARAESAGRLDRDELLAMVQLLLVAGQETTVDLIANALRLLLSRREQWDALVADPSRAGAVVEESLRFRGPVEIVPPRRARVPVTIGGGTVPANDLVGLSLWGANRDPAVFERPHEFDIDRSDAGRHLAFGRGAHFCLGSALGRLEARVMLEHLAQRLPTVRLDVHPDEVDAFRLHRHVLPLRFGPSGACRPSRPHHARGP